MAKKPTLGRGLAALLGEAATAGAAIGEGLDISASVIGDEAASTSLPARVSGVVELPIDSIKRNPRQPRRVFAQDALEELAASIQSVGVVQPVIVRRVEGFYELIAGERRWRAAQLAGYTVIPAIIREASDTESLELALVENVVREQLNPIEEAYAFKVLLEDLEVTQETLAARIGRSRSAIANKIRLLDLPAVIQESLASGALTEGHGRALLGLNERGQQVRLARKVVDKGLSVRQVEDEVRRLTARADTEQVSPGLQKDADLDQTTLDEVREVFFGVCGVMPRIKGKKRGGGVIELPFKDREQLLEILARLTS